ncbi:alpha-1,6-mannosyl-glycoprotein 4-beta-N-acetylglucosaminyltransferase-like [Ctenodactylus gundi]
MSDAGQSSEQPPFRVNNGCQKEKKQIVLQIVQDQIHFEVKNHLNIFKEIQNTSPLLQHANYTLLAGAPPPEKKLLTVGISSVRRPHGSYLLDTLKSLFQASLGLDLEYFVVLVHLSDADPEWLRQTVANVSELFASYIRAQKLLVIHGLLGGSPQGASYHFSPCQKLYSKQKADYALLVHFASNLSEYLLLMDDNIQCTPKFASAIYRALSAWKELPWVILEFSSLRFSGKVFHTSDLSRLTSFFFLIHKNIPTHLLLSKFYHFSAQNIPIRFGTSLFYPMDSDSGSQDTCFPAEKVEGFGEPDNPAAVVVTDMMPVLPHVIPQYAYVLNEESFACLDPLKGNHFTVVLDRPQRVTRIVVLTGSHDQGAHRLEQGQVRLGYGRMENPQRCAHYTLLGPLVAGNLDQQVFYEDDSAEKLSCIQLMVVASQESWLLIRQIKVWAEPEEEESEWA